MVVHALPVSSFVFDPAENSGAAWPAWITPVASAAGNSTLVQTAFDVSRPPDAPSSDLLLTIVFDEGDGGFLRAYRQDGDAAEMISENLFEGTGLPNQRTLLLHNVGAQGPTKIVFQSGGPGQPLHRVVWEWPRSQVVAVLGEEPGLIRHHNLLAAGEISGQPLPVPLPRVDVDYTSTPLLDVPTRVVGSAAFGATLDGLPAHTRLTAKILGLPLDQQLDCWINGRRVGTFAAALPPLQSPAYLLPPGQDGTLASWREASLYLPVKAWRDGENEIEFRPAQEEGGNATVYALKDVVLELVYQDVPSSSPPAKASAVTPTP